jgi:hypothetical protein
LTASQLTRKLSGDGAPPEEPRMPLPDFFLIGAPKAGTTALHAALASHPQLSMSRVKEPKFFLGDGTPPVRPAGPGDAHSVQEHVWRREDYEDLWPERPGALRGESTPFYLSDRAALDRIAAAAPGARLIAVLRHPVDRAYSNWAHLWADGLEPLSDFVAACADEERRMAEGWAPFWRYLGLGRYGEQLQAVHERFPRERVHVLRYRDLVDAPIPALNGICAFLGVEPDAVVDVPSQNVSTYVPPSPTTKVLQAAVRSGASLGRHLPPQVWRRASAPLLSALRRTGGHRPELSPADRVRLLAGFADDIALLELATGQSFADWLVQSAEGTYSVRRSWAPSGRVAS